MQSKTGRWGRAGSSGSSLDRFSPEREVMMNTRTHNMISWTWTKWLPTRWEVLPWNIRNLYSWSGYTAWVRSKLTGLVCLQYQAVQFLFYNTTLIKLSPDSRISTVSCSSSCMLIWFLASESSGVLTQLVSLSDSSECTSFPIECFWMLKHICTEIWHTAAFSSEHITTSLAHITTSPIFVEYLQFFRRWNNGRY